LSRAGWGGGCDQGWGGGGGDPQRMMFKSEDCCLDQKFKKERKISKV